MQYLNTILYDKRHRAQPMKVTRKSGRKASDNKRKADAMHDLFADKMERRDARKAERRARRG